MRTQCTPEEEFDQEARGLFPTLLSLVRVEALNRAEGFKLALVRSAGSYIVNASSACIHGQCWLHFLRFERLDGL
jgi:hypothetical protein